MSDHARGEEWQQRIEAENASLLVPRSPSPETHPKEKP